MSRMSDNYRLHRSTPGVARGDRDAVVPANQHTCESDASSPAALLTFALARLCSQRHTRFRPTHRPQRIGKIYGCIISGVADSLFRMMPYAFRQSLARLKSPIDASFSFDLVASISSASVRCEPRKICSTLKEGLRIISFAQVAAK